MYKNRPDRWISCAQECSNRTKRQNEKLTMKEINDRRVETTQPARVAMSQFDYRRRRHFCCCCCCCEGVTGVKVRMRMLGCCAVPVECSSLYRDVEQFSTDRAIIDFMSTGQQSYSTTADNGINGCLG